MRRLALPIMLTIALAPRGSAADDERGTVLRVEGVDIYTDLGIDDGVGPGSSLVLYHVVVAQHPVTRKKIRDTFPIGALQVVNAGRKVSIATGRSELLERIAVGDELEPNGEPRVFVDPWAERTRPRGSKKARQAALAMRRERERAQREREVARAQLQVEEEEAAERAWRETLGQPPASRIEIWKNFLREQPDTPYAGAVRAEIASLRGQLEAERERELGLGKAEAAREVLDEMLDADGWVLPEGELLALPPTRVYEGAPLDVAFHSLALEVERGWVYYRTAGDDTYRRGELRADAAGYLRFRVPGAHVRPPALEYFVQILPVSATEPRAAIGMPDMPERVAVDASVEEPPPDIRGRSRLRVFLDAVDFDASSEFDNYVQSEIDFTYRFRTPIYALRIGFGALGGTGGPKDVIDEFEETCTDGDGVYHCRKVNFHYSYVELEHRFTDVVAVMLRPMAGSAWRDPRRAEGVEREYFDALGLRARLRLGREAGTNLALGVQLIDQLGTAFEGAFTWDVIPKFPVVLSALVTDQPVPEDFGVRLIADVGWRGVDWVYPSLRLSYQARDLDHAGLGGGLALNFDW